MCCVCVREPVGGGRIERERIPKTETETDLAETGDLHEEHAVVRENVLNLVEIDLEVGNADMLGHLDGRNLVKLVLLVDVAVVLATDLHHVFELFHPVLLIAPLGALDGKRDADGLCAVIGGGVAAR